MTRTFALYGCAPCHSRWWSVGDEPNPGHECTATPPYPSAGMLVARLEEPEHPHPYQIRQAAA